MNARGLALFYPSVAAAITWLALRALRAYLERRPLVTVVANVAGAVVLAAGVAAFVMYRVVPQPIDWDNPPVTGRVVLLLAGLLFALALGMGGQRRTRSTSLDETRAAFRLGLIPDEPVLARKIIWWVAGFTCILVMAFPEIFVGSL